jgi:hypothetical protein|tara:strand:+ start:1508 stop:1750 length:243 start_codon:yes stop_codon:yes gene_type:complete
MTYEFRFTKEQTEGIHLMYSVIYDNYSAIKAGGVRRKRLLAWMGFLNNIKDRKTYSNLSQSKLNEIRQLIIKNKYKLIKK